MATLGDFGFKKGRNHQRVDSTQLENKHSVFINPVSLLSPTKTPKSEKPVQEKKTTIQHYFAPKPQLDTISDESAIVCVVRKKQSICSLWEFISSECEQQTLFQAMIPKQKKKKKRSCPMNLGRPIKRTKYQQDMSSILQQLVRLNTHPTIKPSQSSVDLLSEYQQEEEEEENMSRQVKGKMSTEASHSYVIQIAQEFLCLS
ncbi:hypothetical protein A0J61_07424 [Choanephora cucurbitarum]|uniref:Uncharacterized protein n=1 Tax=Choanephora cucurbitarum TaxID=101091 RepID=A0A1C7N5U9_9FUNG|nr:hypothetical protein A0J61_07424 [Choanephora cucurbitarum]